MAPWNTDATPEQIEDAFQEACARAEHACVGQIEAEVYNWLRITTHREVARQRRRSERERVIDVPVDDLELVDHCAPGAEVAVIRREDRVEVARITNVVLERLSERQLHVMALHTRGLARRKIAEHLGLSERAVKRSMEQIGSRDARLAQLHVATCQRCGAMYERLPVMNRVSYSRRAGDRRPRAGGGMSRRSLRQSTVCWPGEHAGPPRTRCGCRFGP